MVTFPGTFSAVSNPWASTAAALPWVIWNSTCSGSMVSSPDSVSWAVLPNSRTAASAVKVSFSAPSRYWTFSVSSAATPLPSVLWARIKVMPGFSSFTVPAALISATSSRLLVQVTSVLAPWGWI